MIADLRALKALMCKDADASDAELDIAVYKASSQGAELNILPSGVIISQKRLDYPFSSDMLMDALSNAERFKPIIFKAPEHEVYSVQIDEDAYLIPLLSSVYEAGTSDPQKVASRLLVNAGCGFWAFTDSIDDDKWHKVETDEISEKWRTFIEHTALNGHKL